MNQAASPVPGRYLTFFLGTSYYAVSVSEVREVVRLCPITSVPQMPDYIRGVINLRGSVLAVLDLRAKFQMASTEYSDRACIIVFDYRNSGRLTQVGAIVDGVDDVVVMTAAHLAPPPDFAGSVDARFLAGVATTATRVCSVLSMHEILSTDSSFGLPDVNSLSAQESTGSP